MNIYLIILSLATIILTVLLIYFICTNKLKGYKEKMDKAEAIIEECLEKKLDIIIQINSQLKKVTGKKDYLKDYVLIKDLIITNIEKDLKEDEALKLINDLSLDFSELKNDQNIQNNLKQIKDIDTTLTSAKNIFNQYALSSNQYLKTFPYKFVAKLTKYRIRSYYNNKTDSEETF